MTVQCGRTERALAFYLHQIARPGSGLHDCVRADQMLVADIAQCDAARRRIGRIGAIGYPNDVGICFPEACDQLLNVGNE